MKDINPYMRHLLVVVPKHKMPLLRISSACGTSRVLAQEDVTLDTDGVGCANCKQTVLFKETFKRQNIGSHK